MHTYKYIVILYLFLVITITKRLPEKPHTKNNNAFAVKLTAEMNCLCIHSRWARYAFSHLIVSDQ